MKILWDFTIQTDHHLPHNRPDIVLYSYQYKTVFLIDISVPGDAKVNDKVEKYTDLKIELQRMWNFCVIIVPLVIGCLGSV